MDMYDFLYGSYAKTSRDKLLEFMARWSEIDAWRDLSQEELAKRYCARMAEGMWAQHGPKQPSATDQNIKPRT